MPSLQHTDIGVGVGDAVGDGVGRNVGDGLGELQVQCGVHFFAHLLWPLVMSPVLHFRMHVPPSQISSALFLEAHKMFDSRLNIRLRPVPLWQMPLFLGVVPTKRLIGFTFPDRDEHTCAS